MKEKKNNEEKTHVRIKMEGFFLFFFFEKYGRVLAIYWMRNHWMGQNGFWLNSCFMRNEYGYLFIFLRL
jgi:hypothetical protein